mmetsp:Transcript_2486/g.5556  ORF Transcript_2486/g.5556 Transcript_2486/m.5556 type:complete len:111 (+) Transcript_2486:156-488(+)
MGCCHVRRAVHLGGQTVNHRLNVNMDAPRTLSARPSLSPTYRNLSPTSPIVTLDVPATDNCSVLIKPLMFGTCSKLPESPCRTPPGWLMLSHLAHQGRHHIIHTQKQLHA